jgi:hypothetical protein
VDCRDALTCPPPSSGTAEAENLFLPVTPPTGLAVGAVTLETDFETSPLINSSERSDPPVISIWVCEHSPRKRIPFWRPMLFPILQFGQLLKVSRLNTPSSILVEIFQDSNI